jgi:hypothetical protein
MRCFFIQRVSVLASRVYATAKIACDCKSSSIKNLSPTSNSNQLHLAYWTTIGFKHERWVMLSNAISPFPMVWQLGLLVVAAAVNSACGYQQGSSLFVEGYPHQQSYVPGEKLQLHISSSADKAELLIERVGSERTKVYQAGDIKVSQAPIPVRSSSEGCNWPVATELTIPENWLSGYYEVTFSVKDRGGEFVQRGERSCTSKCYFVLRAATPGSTSRILLQLSTNTYNAYTNWGGHSLYAYHDRDGLQGHRVSFHRPQTSQFYNWEYPFVQWAEKNGFTIEYAANNDLEYHAEILKNYRLVLSVGHDEYWSAPMRDNLEAFVKTGGNRAFFSGNTCCWQIRNEDQGRAFTCYKQWYNSDPHFSTGKHNLLSTLWSHHLVARPENQLTGVGFLWGGYHKSHGQLMDGTGAFTVHRPDHWLFEQTQLAQGSQFGGEETIVGYECDGCELQWRDGLPFPTGSDGTPDSFVVLATSPAKWHPDDSLWYDRFPADRQGNAVLGVYTQGGTVFTAGSTDWSHGLRGKTPLVEQITKNILNRLSRPAEAR